MNQSDEDPRMLNHQERPSSGPYGAFPKWGYPKIDGWFKNGKSYEKMDDN